MPYHGTSDLLRSAVEGCDGRAGEPSQEPLATRIDCLEQILEAFRDIAERDDIHQAAQRLALAQQWISREAECAAADPIFADLRLV